MSKKPNSSIKVAAMSLNMTVEQVEEMLDVNMALSVCKHEKRQIADMYKKLYDQNERSTAQYNGIIDTQLKVIDELKAEVERLTKAEVERLRKEGEAMYPNLGPGWSHNAKQS